MFKIFNNIKFTNLINLTSETTEKTESITFGDIVNVVIEWITTEGLKLLIGLVVLFISFKIVNILAKTVKKKLEKKNRDKTIISVINQIIRKGLKGLILLGVLGYVGIDTAGIGTIIASAGVAIGLALQGSLANFAGGILILVLRPFKLGDFIECQGESGTVEVINVFYTHLITPDNKVVMIPNGALINGNITNYSKKALRRVDFTFSISYDEDFERAKEVINNVISSMDKILSDPKPFVRLHTHGESTINIVARVWTKSEDYWDVYFDMMEAIKKNFDEAKIEIPYNQLDVHIKDK